MGPRGGALVLLLLLFLHGGQQAAEAGGGAFVRVQGTRFVHDGKPFFANGFNAYWLMTLGADPAQRGKVTSALSQAAGAGLSVARTWAFSDGASSGSNALQYSPGRYNENTFQGLDFVLAEARKYGIKMILSLVNSYDSFGGRRQYVQWAREQGQAIGSDDEFFTNPVTKGLYKNHIKAVLTRVNTMTGVAYKDDPTIMAWELMNEPRCPSDVSGRTIQSWITEMAAHVKSIDGNHLLEAGLEGFYGPSSSRGSVNPSGYQVGTDFIANNQAPGIDFATVHSYPDLWLPGADAQSQLRFLGTWLDAHIADARAVLRKPLLVAEFGKVAQGPGVQRRPARRVVRRGVRQGLRLGARRRPRGGRALLAAHGGGDGLLRRRLRGRAPAGAVHHGCHHDAEPEAAGARQGVRARAQGPAGEDGQRRQGRQLKLMGSGCFVPRKRLFRAFGDLSCRVCVHQCLLEMV